MPYYNEDITYYPTLEDALNAENVDYLKKLVTLLPSTDKPTRKAEIVALIMRHLEGDGLKERWLKLDDTQKSAIAETVHAESSLFDAPRFAAKYGVLPDFGQKDVRGYDLIPSCLYLFFYKLILPEDLKARLKAFVSSPPPVIIETLDEIPTMLSSEIVVYDPTTKKTTTETEEVPVTVCEMEQAAQHDLHAVLRLINTGKLGISDKTLQPTAATVRTVSALLYGGDYFDSVSEAAKNEYDDEDARPIKAQAWPLIVQAAKLAEMTSKKLTLTKAGQKALVSPVFEILKSV